MITPEHWSRLLEGVLFAISPRVDWATLLRRTYAEDALECPRCHGRMRLVAAITDRDLAHQLLAELGMSTKPARTARARDPTSWEPDPDFLE
jgi:hypothetical protein